MGAIGDRFNGFCEKFGDGAFFYNNCFNILLLFFMIFMHFHDFFCSRARSTGTIFHYFHDFSCIFTICALPQTRRSFASLVFCLLTGGRMPKDLLAHQRKKPSDKRQAEPPRAHSSFFSGFHSRWRYQSSTFLVINKHNHSIVKI